MKKLTVILLLIFTATLYAQQPSGVEILEKVDNNYEAKSHVSVTTMVVKGRRGTRTMKSKSWSEGSDRVFTVYLAPAREKDTKMLKLKDELWLWNPSTDRTIRIAGHMLRQSMMGSDLSYEDFMEDPKLANTYDVKVIGEESVEQVSSPSASETLALQKRLCWILELTAKKGQEVAYYSRKLWVDQERYLPLKQELFAKSGKLLKTFTINKVFKIGTRWYPKKMTFKDVLKKGSGTEFIIESIKFDVKIPKIKFSKASLRR